LTSGRDRGDTAAGSGVSAVRVISVSRHAPPSRSRKSTRLVPVRCWRRGLDRGRRAALEPADVADVVAALVVGQALRGRAPIIDAGRSSHLPGVRSTSKRIDQPSVGVADELVDFRERLGEQADEQQQRPAAILVARLSGHRSA
jgi:hypothetical protein